MFKCFNKSLQRRAPLRQYHSNIGVFGYNPQKSRPDDQHYKSKYQGFYIIEYYGITLLIFDKPWKKSIKINLSYLLNLDALQFALED